MRATVMYGAHDVRVETVPDARIVEPTDALIRVTRACICGSDLWPYNSMPPNETGNRMGHEFIGVVESVGTDVRTVKKGDLGAIRLVRRHLRILPTGTADVGPPWRMVGRHHARRRPRGGRPCTAGGRNVGGASCRR
jgi:NADPH:quinone reductase-like Zn-dependent oxidoreductase